ncbi:MAG: nucleoside deaminase [Candidatus Enteromonas sp.]|nr:nucleoside deaminase [Candidatus Enteromonas sp.]
MNPYMEEALAEARLAAGEEEIPVGAVVVENGVIVGRGHNRREATFRISSHAEIEALEEAAKAKGTWNLKGCSLYVTLEPCLMCFAACKQSRLSSIVFGADDLQEGAFSAYHMDPPSFQLVYRGEGKEEAEALLKGFFEKLRTE